MSDYTQVNNFTAKDDLPAGAADKRIYGVEWDEEFNALVTAIASKYDSADVADQSTAEAGASSTTVVTPLRVEQELVALRYMLPARLDLRAAYDYLASQATILTQTPTYTDVGLSYDLSAAAVYLVTGLLIANSQSSNGPVHTKFVVSQTPVAIGVAFRDAFDLFGAEVISSNSGVASLENTSGSPAAYVVRGVIVTHATLASTLTVQGASDNSGFVAYSAGSFLRLSRIA